MWYAIDIRKQSQLGEFSADILIPADSDWFDGHFPGNPVLPGIAQLGMVFEVLGRMIEGDVQVMQVQRVRFRQMILPGDRVVVGVQPKPDKNGLHAFRILKDGEVICTGGMAVAPGINKKDDWKPTSGA